MQTLARIAVVPLLALALSACGSETEKKSVASAGGKQPAKTAAEKKGNFVEKQRKWAKCMRANGVNIPDPSAGGGFPAGKAEGGAEGGGVAKVEEPGPQEKKALEKCKDLMPQGDDLPKPKPDDVKKAREFAKCMRKNGVTDFPDPDANGGILIGAGGDGKMPAPKDKFEKAMKACQKLLGEGNGIGIGLTR